MPDLSKKSPEETSAKRYKNYLLDIKPLASPEHKDYSMFNAAELNHLLSHEFTKIDERFLKKISKLKATSSRQTDLNANLLKSLKDKMSVIESSMV